MDQKTLQIITSKSQADKAINSLKGILLGINLDKVVNNDEIQELKNWVKKHHELVLRNPFREFMLIIDSIAEEDLGLTETIEKLNLDMIDPSDSMRNFIHNMNFKKTSGFTAVERVS